MAKPASTPLPPIDVVAYELDHYMKRLGPTLGWDSPAAFIKRIGAKNEPDGVVTVRFMGHQGSVRMVHEHAMAYLEWLRSGQRGSAMKWAQLHKVKLS